MSIVELVESPAGTLGPLTASERRAIMEHAPSLSTEGRRLFRRLLVLAHERGLSGTIIARAASQAREHMAAFEQ